MSVGIHHRNSGWLVLRVARVWPGGTGNASGTGGDVSVCSLPHPYPRTSIFLERCPPGQKVDCGTSQSINGTSVKLSDSEKRGSEVLHKGHVPKHLYSKFRVDI